MTPEPSIPPAPPTDAGDDVMDLMLNTPVPTSRRRPDWLDPMAHWTDHGELSTHYVPEADRPRGPWWLPIAVSGTAALFAIGATAAIITGIALLLP